jgi:hypothetical protein
VDCDVKCSIVINNGHIRIWIRIEMACWSFTEDDFKGSAGWTVITRKSCDSDESKRLVHAFTFRVENG